MWQRYPDAAAALIVSPTPYGTCADLESIVEICHARGKPLIVDEAWGAHLPFHDELPTWAMSAGADVCVVSVHKMGMGFEQGSVYHLQGALVDPVRLSQCADLLATTSSNVMLFAAIDGWRRQMVRQGRELLSSTLSLVRKVRRDVEALPGLHVLETELLGAEASHDLDPLHVVIDLSQLGISGYQAADWLRDNCKIDVGINDHRRIEATMSMSDNEDTAQRLLDSLHEVGPGRARLARPRRGEIAHCRRSGNGNRVPSREAFFGPVEVVPAEEAAGRIAAEQITPYPPGIPAILPGERINVPWSTTCASGVAAGMVLPDPADPSMKTVRVVQE